MNHFQNAAAASSPRLTWAAQLGMLSLLATSHLWTTPAQAQANQIALDEQPVAWVSPIEFNSFKLSSGSAVAFRADYVRATWDGDLVAHDIAADGTWSVKWRAQEQLPAHGSRIIFTSTTSGNGSAFRWSSILPAQQAALGDATTGPKVLDYLRGDAYNEQTVANPNGIFRGRYSRLGGVVHSRPYVVGSVVYVGANDGMLHAFDTTTGVEKFAYVPSMLFGNGRLLDISSKASVGLKYGVDAPLAIGKVGTANWLFAGLGAGAKGLFALDISNPSPTSEAAAAAMAKWEITSSTAGYANLGHVMTAPQLVRLNDGVTALLVPNGLNSAAGVSSLFVIRASDGALLREITAGAASSTAPNGLGGIAAVDKNGDGKVDLVYAGDLKGTLWKFDLSSATLPNSATALFTPDAATARPITVAPSVSTHPRGGLLVNFGTGRVYTDADLTSTTADYLYGIWDNGTPTSSSLVVQTLTTHSVGSPVVNARTASANAVSYGPTTKGWRITLGTGERLVGADTLTDGGRYTVTTTVPNAGATQGAWLVGVSALTGAAPATPFFDLDGNGSIDTTGDSDRIVTGTGSTAQSLIPVSRFLGAGVWSQPVLAQYSNTLDLPFLNFNPNNPLPSYTVQITTTPSTSGVFGGHFDYDIFYKCDATKSITKGNCGGHEHVHEYDDKFNVVGVNMLNPSDAGFRLSNAIPSTTTPAFKVLLSNTLWSPGATMVIGDTISGQSWKIPVSPEGFVAEVAGGPAKVFANRAELSKFIFVLPLTAFGARDWGTGQVRAGLIPTTTGCIQSNANPAAAWMDGAFTIQVVDASATASDVQPNTSSLYEAVDPPGGYRLKDTNTARSKLLAQYSTFWHTGKCRTQAGWTMAPATSSASDGKGSSPAGTDDPKGLYASGVTGGPGTVGSGTETKYLFNGVEVLVTQSYSLTGVRQVITNLSGTTVLSDVTSAFGQLAKAPIQINAPARLGRMGWKEVIR